jgi:alkaline phosphatase D
MARLLALIPVAACLALASGAAAAPSGNEGSGLRHGVVVGEVTPQSALLWARGAKAGTLRVSLAGGPHGPIEPVQVTADDDWTGQVPLQGLAPATEYGYRVQFDPGGHTARGSFTTPPGPNESAAVRLAFGGDVAGQNVCRDADEGFPIMDTIRVWRPDVFVGLGDMIYADNACTHRGLYGNVQRVGAFGPATDLAGFWAHWRYNRADAASRRLLASTSYIGVWDDHEVINDFGPLTDVGPSPPYPPGVHLLPIGRRAFLDYTPVAGAPRLYRSFRWGRHLELFVLDTRSYRDANNAPDDPQQPKTMLGEEQLAWLKDGLEHSDATWKVIVSSVPMSIPTGFPAANGRDGWANFDQVTGFENELVDILHFMADHGIEHPVWITTDVHFAEAFRYEPFPVEHPGFVVHELATGPLNAGIFPNAAVDQTLNPEVLFFGPEAGATSWDEAKSGFSFGALEVGAGGALKVQVLGIAGQPRFSLSLADQTSLGGAPPGREAPRRELRRLRRLGGARSP